MQQVTTAQAIPGGLDGDRYANRAGTFTPAADAAAATRP